MKKILLQLTFTTLLLSVAYSQCNESNWEEYYPEMQECDLSDAYLIFADFSQADLSQADLSNADLIYANLSGANLTGADLSYANLSYADLSYAYLCGANLIGATLYNANLSGANLDDVDLTWANLAWANLCNLTGSPGGGVCEQPDGITDEDGDGYDDVSYEVGYEIGAESGDINLDGSNDVLDVVLLTNCIILDNCDE